MRTHEKVSTGIPGLNQAIDHLRMGDNVVWQVDHIDDYRQIVKPFTDQAKKDGRKIIYIRFGTHQPVLRNLQGIKVIETDASLGFETFATQVHNIIEQEGSKAFYVFDCLTEFLQFWHSDLMIGNFFRVTCPFLYILDTVAYFAIKRNLHTYDTIARIRETTQCLLDLYSIEEKMYIHPLKAWERYSPTMFFPHLIEGNEAISITASTQAVELFSCFNLDQERMDYWNVTIEKAKKSLQEGDEEQKQMKMLLISTFLAKKGRMNLLCEKYLDLQDILRIASREIGTGFIGGKSVGMILARKILKTKKNVCNAWEYLEPDDSFFIGTDVFYTYIVQNDWWELRTRQKTGEGYFTYAGEFREKLLSGSFPETIENEFVRMLEYFGQSPIIVRSSSLQEDNFGNAFAGKYQSIIRERIYHFFSHIICLFATNI